MNRNILEKPFQTTQISHRPGLYGGRLAYVDGSCVIQRLNEAFESDWSFEVVAWQVMEHEAVVLGRLSAAGRVKMQFGTSRLTPSDGAPGTPGTDLKAAATDALKKAAMLFGVGLHLALPAQREAPEPASPPRQGTPPISISARQRRYLQKLADELGWGAPELAGFCLGELGIDPAELSRESASKLIALLQRRRNQSAA